MCRLRAIDAGALATCSRIHLAIAEALSIARFLRGTPARNEVTSITLAFTDRLRPRKRPPPPYTNSKDAHYAHTP